MQTTLEHGQKRHSGMQEMGETREPMARDCWDDANRLAGMYSTHLQHDFWLMYAAKPHVKIRNGIVAGWEVTCKRPSAGIVGVLIFKWDHKDKRLVVETDLCLPYDVPLSDAELSTSVKDHVQGIEAAAKKSGSILLA